MIRNHVGGNFYWPEAYFRHRYYPKTGSPPGYYTPTMWVDGVDEMTGTYTNISLQWAEYKSMISARRDVPSPLAMDLQVEYGAKSDTGTVYVEVVATDTIPFSGLRLRMTIVESDLSYSGDTYHQVLRDYFPDRYGIAFSIAEGDTFTHSEDFVITPAIVEVDENCDIVVFVQDDTTREVLQSIQSPLIAPVPDQVADLLVHKASDELVLEWSPVAADTGGNPLTVDLYQIYRDTVASFGPGADPFDSTTDTFYVDGTGVVGDADTHYYYSVTAVAGSKESEYSDLVGEFDRVVATGK